MSKLAILGGRRAVTESSQDYLELDTREEGAVLASLRGTPLTTLYGGWDVERFEQDFGKRFGFAHCVAMSSGTASLHAALAAVGVEAGDEVITPTVSFVASASVIVQQGARPVFCDIDRGTLGLDVEHCQSLITPRTRAVIVVHVYGMPARIDRLAQVCRDAEIALIEDCAGAVGARCGDSYVGGFGEVGCFSFNVGKILRTGEGGMASTRDEVLRDRLRELRVNGLNPEHGVNHVVRLGFNYTLAQPLAALGVAQLERFDGLLKARYRNRELLRDGCRHLPVEFFGDPPGLQSVPYWMPMLLPRELAPWRHKILAAVQAEGVRLSIGYGEPLYRIGYLARFAGRSYPVTEDLASRLVVLDPSPYLSESVIGQYIDGLHKVFGNLDQLESTPPDRGARR